MGSLKIGLFVHDCHRGGGNEQYVLELAQALARSNAVSIFCHRIKEVVDPAVSIRPVRGGSDRIAIIRILLYFLDGTLKVLRARKDFDILHSVGGNMWGQNVMTIQFCHATWGKMVRGCGIEGVRGRRGPYETLTTGLASLLDRVVLSTGVVRRIIANSERTKRDFVEAYHIRPEMVDVVYNGVDPNRFHPDNRRRYRAVIRQELGLDEAETVLLFVGAYERKGLPYLLRAMPRFSDRAVTVVAVGTGNVPHHVEVARRLGIADRVHFVPPQRLIEHYFAAADAFVFPTLYEPFGMVITEAMASGLPVITSAGAGAAELIEDGKDGLLLQDPRNPDEIASCVNALLADPSRCRSMGQAAREKAVLYSWEYVREATERVYAKAIAESGRPTGSSS
jgi:UDP-glucose:(heptosyl)LPS alpha-1,3-glucosyltransferase